ncbi:hypothetical protein GUJ93_ZPchr0004g39235 [Zizania palustris]|uniref:Uncharacterized protein n=1 Tax=Zizania palustris TaxID=103762 RepID=A0A8J5VFK6_ZIZPA|nr:hypothetical protein GUJ93_ZPchr0004g39235 [Zizania palustris]
MTRQLLQLLEPAPPLSLSSPKRVTAVKEPLVVPDPSPPPRSRRSHPQSPSPEPAPVYPDPLPPPWSHRTPPSLSGSPRHHPQNLSPTHAAIPVPEPAQPPSESVATVTPNSACHQSPHRCPRTPRCRLGAVVAIPVPERTSPSPFRLLNFVLV